MRIFPESKDIFEMKKTLKSKFLSDIKIFTIQKFI